MDVEYVQSEKLWRSSASEISPYGLGHEILTQLRAGDPNRIFEVYYDTGRSLTVKDILDQTITVAQNLTGLGINKGDVVLLYSNLNDRVTPITFACYTIGAPINFFDMNFEGEEISQAISQIDPSVILFEEKFKCRLTKALESVKLSGLKYTLSIDAESASNEDILFKPVGGGEAFEAVNIGDPAKHPAIYIFSSGSTGFPKTIVHSHSMMKLSVKRLRNLPSYSRIYCFSALRWVTQVIWMLQPAFFVVTRIYTSGPPTPAQYIEIIDNSKINYTFTAPGLFLEMLKILKHSTDPRSLSTLQCVLLGGEVASKSLKDLADKVLPNCKVSLCYGMTEIGCLATNEYNSKRDVNGGVILRNFMVKVIDDDGKPLGPGEMGRICTKMTVPFLKYLRNEASSKESFIEDGWLNTGDYGFVDSENLLNIVGRYKDLVRSAETIIIPTEVEDIVNSCPKVSLSILVGHSEDPKSPSNKVGTVFVVPNDMTSITRIEEDLRNFVKDKFTKEQLRMVRHFKAIAKFPRTPSQKTDRLTLKEMARVTFGNQKGVYE